MNIMLRKSQMKQKSKNLQPTILRRKKVLKTEHIIILAIIIVISLLLAFFVPEFWTIKTISNILVSTSSIGLLAVGLSFVLVGGGLDISLPAVMAASAVVGAKVMVATQNIFVGIISMFAVALAFGVVNGVATSVFKMIPFIVTMATMVLAQGLAALVSQSVSINGLPKGYSNIAGDLGHIPVPVIILLVFGVLGYLILNKSVFGRYIFAIGNNENTAMVCSVKVTKTKLLTYIIASLYAGILAVILTARLNSASAMMASNTMNLDVLAAAVLGGVSMQGGRGSVFGAFLGALIITSLSTIMNLLGVNNFLALTYKGIIILAITYFDTLRLKSREKTI